MLRADRLLAGAALAAAILIGLSGGSPAFAATAYATTSDQGVAMQIDAAHDGNLAHDTLAPPLAQAWSVPLSYPNYPVVDNGKVFITYQQPTGGQPTLAALTLATGAIAWGPISVGGNTIAELALDGGRLFVLNDTGSLAAIDENSGRVAWTASLGSQTFFTAPTAINGIVYTTAGQAVYAVRETDGTLLWTANVVDAVSIPTVSATGVYVATRCGHAYDFDPITGALIWQHSVPTCTSGNASTPVLAGGRLYVVAGNGGADVILDAATGASYGPFASSVPPAFRGSRVFFEDAYGLHAADLPAGTPAWNFSGDGALSSSPIIVNGVVYVGSAKGNVYGIDATSGSQVWTAAVSGPIPTGQSSSGLAAGYGMLFVPSSQALSAFAGQETLYPGDATWTNVPVGQSSTPPAPFTLTNNTVSGGLTPTISISGDFSQTNNCPTSLAIGANCVVSVTFSPTAGGTRTGTLTITDNAAGSPHVIALTGVPTPPGPLDHITMTTSATSIQAGANGMYAVEAYDANGTDLGSVTASSTFAIAPDGSCTAATCTATLSGAHTVTATYSGKTASANLTVTPAAAARLTVSPSSATIVAGGSETYTAIAIDQYGNTVGDVTASTTFSFNSGPSCSANVCSSTKAFPWTIVASYGSFGASAQLTVKAGPLASLVLAPANTTMFANASQSYNAEGFDQYGNDLGNLASASTFAITPDGTCVGISCSPAKAGIHTVTATDGTVSGTATITATVGPPYRLVVSPANTTIRAGGSATFSAEAFDQYNNDLGDVTAQTAFTLDSPSGPACTGNVCTTTVAPGHQVVGSYQSLFGYASLTVTPGPLDHMTFSPSGISITAGTYVQYRTFGYDRYNNSVGEITGATNFAISPDGTCTGNVCGSTKSGAHTITGADGTVTSTTGLAVTAAGVATLSVTPSTTTLTAGQGQAYRAEAFDQYGNDSGDYTAGATFAIAPDGTCSGNLCSATKAGSHTVTASWTSVSGTASLTITAGPLASLAVTPAGVDSVVGQSTVLTASGQDSYGNPVILGGSVTWATSSGTPGTLSALTGATTTFKAAATTAGTGKVVAKSGTLSATVAVTVHPAAPTQLAATTNGRKANLTWTTAAGDWAFAVYRQSATGSYTLIAIIASTAYSDGNLSAGTTYNYYVVGIGGGGVRSTPSNTASLTIK